MGTIIGLLTARGLSETAARLIAYVGGALLLLGAFAGLVAAYNHHIIGQHEAKIEKRAAPATNQAATERAHDTITNANFCSSARRTRAAASIVSCRPRLLNWLPLLIDARHLPDRLSNVTPMTPDALDPRRR
jgi:disulfide bond formation protein DsbB